MPEGAFYKQVEGVKVSSLKIQSLIKVSMSKYGNSIVYLHQRRGADSGLLYIYSISKRVSWQSNSNDMVIINHYSQETTDIFTTNTILDHNHVHQVPPPLHYTAAGALCLINAVYCL